MDMIHYLVGDVGHLFVIISFVASLASTFIYLKARRSALDAERASWLLNGRAAFVIHSVAVVGVVVSLFTIIARHYFEYHYAFSHSSRDLAPEYMIACFWEGQEGSFLLWMFWHAVLGVILIVRRNSWEAPVMAIVSAVQAFLASMILGVVIPLFEVKIGSSPFVLLREAMNDPIFLAQPDFIPRDGNGLNALLQNYWMVIHPPTLFLGFALTLIPFAYCVAGLWEKKYTEWIKPALPWTLFGGAILGLGILMGGYWAYETLSFGGYWNWDPVENAVYVPWIVLIASMHTMITYKNSSTALKASIILVISVFVLILYSTFLTRSGILGDASVHSFTDLGLSGQLLIYLLFFTLAAVVLLVIRWKEIPTSEKEVQVYSREFWIFLGATILCLMGFQVLLPTSFPVINKIASLVGVESNIATPADQIGFYSRFQLWFGVLIGLVSGTAQFFWWRRIDKTIWKKEVMPVVLMSLVIFAIIIALARVSDPSYMVLTFAGVYIIVSNVRILLTIARSNPRLSGGAVAHLGVGLMLIGLMFSSGYSKVVSLNNNGLLIRRDMGSDFNRENLLLFINEPQVMAEYEIEYLGERLEPRNKNGYVNKSDIEPTDDPFTVIARRDINFKGKLLYARGDTFAIRLDNTFYEIELRKGDKVAATLFPRAQVNPEMGGMLASPDIKNDLTRDLYTHVTAFIPKEEAPEWSELQEVRTTIGQQFFVNDYVAVLENVTRIDRIGSFVLSDEDVAVKATIRVQGERGDYVAEPIFIIRDRKDVGRLPEEINDLAVRLSLLNIHPDTNEFTIGVNTRQKDWVVIKALEKPYINVLWLGTGVLMVGFVMAMVRRFRE
jgi:cytochrome c-type biogenesis protein CcmF